MADKNRASPQVSIRGETYRLVRDYCLEHDITVVAFVSNLCRDFFEKSASEEGIENEEEQAEGSELAVGDEGESALERIGPRYVVQKAETDARFGLKKKYEGKVYIEREVGGGRIKPDAAPLFEDDEKKKWKP